MLRDSLAEPAAAHHVEQLEIVFASGTDAARVDAAWRATVASCEVLRTAFGETGDEKLAQSLAATWPEMEIHPHSLPCDAAWLEENRLRPVLNSGRVPWRTSFHPTERKWLWTFHHALLDGRSITRILQVFLNHLEDKPCENLSHSLWRPPCAEAVKAATAAFQHIRRDCPPLDWPPDLTDDSAPAVRRLGREIAGELETQAVARQVTAATIVTWAWGQALADFLGTDAVLVEQLRAGPPQPATAGFTMNVLPLMIRRSSVAALPAFRSELLAMRAFESVSPENFPAGIYPETSAAPVIMVEHETLPHALREFPEIESVTLHERPADFPSATAFLHPELQLQVEGPHRHDLLARWGAILKSPDFCIAGVRTAAGRVRR